MCMAFKVWLGLRLLNSPVRNALELLNGKLKTLETSNVVNTLFVGDNRLMLTLGMLITMM